MTQTIKLECGNSTTGYSGAVLRVEGKRRTWEKKPPTKPRRHQILLASAARECVGLSVGHHTVTGSCDGDQEPVRVVVQAVASVAARIAVAE